MPQWAMRFADPSVCPSCAAPINGMVACATCGFSLTSQPARELWQTLLQADALLEKARSVGAAPATAAPATAVPAPPTSAPLPSAPPRLDRPVSRTWSTGSILLALGALFILIAGFIFITVSWGSLGVTGRALVLLAFTAVVGVLAAYISRRGLRGSAEALWSVFLGLVTVDWFAAWGQGLFGLDSLPFVAVATAWSVVMFAAGLAIIRWARTRLDGGEGLLAPMIVAGVAPWFGAVVLGVQLYDSEDWSPFWAGVVATAFVVALLLVSLRLTQHVTSILLAAAGAFGVVLLIGAALAEAFDNPSLHDLTAERHGLPLLVVVLAAVGTGLLERRGVVGASAVAVLGAATLIALPVETAHVDRGGLIVVAGLVVLGAFVLRRTDSWSRGARIATAILAGGLTLAALPWLGSLGSFVERSFQDSRGDHPFWSRPAAIDDGSGPWWLATVVFAALAVGTVLARWWPELKAARTWLVPASTVVAGAGVVVALAAGEAAFTVVALATIAVGLVLSEVPPRSNLAWSLVGPVVVALAPILPPPSRSATLAVWCVAAVVLATVGVRSTDAMRREAVAFAATGWGLGAAGIGTDLADQAPRLVALSLVVAAAIGLAVASSLFRAVAGRRGVEAGTVLVAVVGITIASSGDVSLGWQAAIWTVLGASVSLVSLFTPDRPHLRWVGFAALGLAYVLRLVASDVETVEAYTLPFGIVLIGAGLWWMRGRPEVSSVRALGSGLLLTLLPSLPAALDEPTSLRALLLGIGAFVAVGGGVAKRWNAPFVAGAAILLLLAIANVGPLALGLPRWVLIASAGAIFIGAGVTWENRVRDGRAVTSYVTSMR
ncbi:hypothetical protein GCM10022234_34010 [Aeromicrobium panaciterrae]|uniref:SCO7613 C-terminal domain-containing membrane protein n=1 Tax=Aeromicrobium panaciterrae TaxID=363861 RepID=UPI0031DBA341